MLAVSEGINWRAPLRRASVVGYRGEDRRGVVVNGDAIGRVVVLTAVLSGLVWAAMLCVDLVSDGAGSSTTVAAFTSALAAAVAVVSGVLSIARWRLVGDALALAAGLALICLGVFTIGVGGIVGAADAASAARAPALIRGLGPAGVVAAVGCLLGALRLPHVDTTLRIARAGAVVAATAAAAAAVIAAVPPALHAVGPGTTTPVGRIIYAAVWAGLALAFARDARRIGRAVGVWVAGLLLCLGQAELARMLAFSFGTTWDLAGRLLTLLATLVAYIGVVRVAQTNGRVLEARLFETLVSEHAARANHEAERAARDELDHDLRSALTAVGGAASVLRRYADRLADADRGQLVESLAAEIARMQSLVVGAREAVQRFDVAAVASRVVRCDADTGLSVSMQVPDRIVACGSPNRTAEILRNLLDNAKVHGGGRRIVVRAAAERDAIVVRVEDGGDGVPAELRERIFERGWSSRANHPSGGSGLGLFVARRLAEEQGGTLTATEGPSGGAAFVLTLPAAQGEMEETG